VLSLVLRLLPAHRKNPVCIWPAFNEGVQDFQWARIPPPRQENEMTSDSVDDLQQNPLWCAGDLGKPLPDSVHAVSVSMPAWAHVIGYEECEEAVINALKCGYPRFFRHPLIQRLFEEASGRFAGGDETSFVFPSEAAAEHCIAFLTEQEGCVARVDAYGANGLFCVTFPSVYLEAAGKFWQHFGDVVSSRCAEATLVGQVESEKADAAKGALRQRIGGFTGEAAENVFLTRRVFSLDFRTLMC
jgi:cystathionine gamma-synthase